MRLTEKKLVEDYLIERLVEKGWRFVPSEELEREELEEPILVSALIRAIEKINANRGLSEEDLKKAINTLKLTGRGVEGSKQVLNYFKFGVPVKLEKERVVERVKLFDYEEFGNNEFIISRQVIFKGRETIRTDIILFVNGIPLVNIECKDPANLSQSWVDGYRQIKRYEQGVPELYKYVQIGIGAEEIARYFPIVPWQEEVHTYEWREEGIEDSLEAIVCLLSRETLLDIIKNFLFFREEGGNKTKVIARYMQYRSGNKIVERVLKRIRGEEDKKRGLIWHWQGSGKTLTMIFSANKLYYAREMENPSIFFVVDRLELEEQLTNECFALDIVRPEVIGSIWELKQVLKYDDYRGKRGLFIVLIHKFKPEELGAFEQELKRVSAEKETIMTRRNVVLFLDEVHRSQYGIMAAQMKDIFKEAFYFGFTGTPISKTGRDTYLEFSHPDDEKKYLDKYFVSDALRDGFTVKIVYQPRLEEDVKLRKDLLEAFYESEFEELPIEKREELEEGINKKLNQIRVFLENEERIQKIAKDISEHFKENLEGRFKGMVVCASRKAAVIYKRELDKLLPPNYSEVVMTYGLKDEQVIQNYRNEMLRRFPGRDEDEARKRIVEDFKERENPKILIVVDMLTTGFDAPILQTMYLDKPLKEHRLLQAIARTNRPYKDLKEAGLIIDYVGILQNLKRAFSMYGEEEFKEVLGDFDGLKAEFVSLLKELMEIFKGLPKNYERRTLFDALELVTQDPEVEEEFVKNYRALRKAFEMLGPDVIKAQSYEDYKWLSTVYSIYLREAVRKEEPVELQRYFEKTLKFVHKATEIEQIQKELPVIEFDENYFKNLEEKLKDKKEKAANILFTLNRLVLVDKTHNPIYETLMEKVERLVQLWREKTKDYERIYQEGLEIIKQINSLSDRQKSLGFNDLEYGILLALEDNLGQKQIFKDKAKELSRSISPFLLPNWITQNSLRKKIEREVREFARGFKRELGLSMEEIDKLYLKLFDRVKNYGI